MGKSLVSSKPVRRRRWITFSVIISYLRAQQIRTLGTVCKTWQPPVGN
jgi:hypothetical protein